MTDSKPADQIRSVIAAFQAGHATSEELETIISNRLRTGELGTSDVTNLLRDSVEADAIPADTLMRLGLGGAFVNSRSNAKTKLRSGKTANTAGADPGRDEESRYTFGSDLGGLSDSTRIEQHSEIGSPSRAGGVGQVLGGRYLLEREIGRGGMGVVYLASDQQVRGETFAIKVLKPGILEHLEALELMREEVRKTRSLRDSNIVGVYSINVDSTDVFILMEYLEGKPLNELLDEEFGRGMPFTRAWPLIQDIGAALACAHDHNVIHSDLKPANVFVTSGRAKLLDFGIARAARGRKQGADAAAIGALTPEYASCEMLEGLEPDPRDDIYSLACVVYEMLSGKRPFGNLNALEARDDVKERRTKSKPARLAALSRKQNDALTRALAFSREQRIARVEQLLADLGPAVRRSPSFIALFSAVTLVLAGAATIGWWLWNNSNPVIPAAKVNGPMPAAAAVLPAAASLPTPTGPESAPVAELPPTLDETQSIPPTITSANPCHAPLVQATLKKALDAGIVADANFGLFATGSPQASDGQRELQNSVDCLKALQLAGVSSKESREWLTGR